MTSSPATSPAAASSPAAGAGTLVLGGHVVPRLGYGAMQLPGRGVWGPPPDHDGAVATVRRAVELGVRVIDTAWYYGPHVANPLLREALAPYPDDLVFVTKLGGARGANRSWRAAMTPAELREGCETDLRELGVDQVPVAHLRWIEEAAGVDFTDALGTLVELRDEGKIGAIGLSNVDLGHLDAARAITEIVTVSNSYGMLSRDDEPVQRRCSAEGIAYLPFFPLGSAGMPGMPGAGGAGKNPAVAALATRLAISSVQLQIAWLLGHSASILPIPGTRSVGHLEENVAAAAVELSPDDLALLDSLSTPGTEESADPVPDVR
jgi:pyridoxine 4-dehydrogenase